MPRFAVSHHERSAEIVFDDGGMNLLSTAALEELRALIGGWPSAAADGSEAGPDATPRQPILVFRSSRPALFAAGADMAEMARFSPREADAFGRLGQHLFAAIERLPWITIAVIDGDCFGGALDLALAFDLRYATPRSRFSHPGARLGIVTGFGGTSRWRKLLDRPAARRLFLGNVVMPAEEALGAGLVDGLGEPDLDRLAALDPALTRMLKELAPRAERLPPRELRLLAEGLTRIYE